MGINMKDDLISIIVPIYKVEKYLNKCIESIVNQTYKNLEIILVDDGSPDNCPAMCDEWAKKDSRIKVIHKENGGLSDARNVGMAIATGDYIGFVDSDDWIREDMYSLLYEDMHDNNSDISACGVTCVYDNETEPTMLTSTGKYTFSTEEAMISIINEDILKQPVWYKLYKRKVIQDISFPVGKLHEDVFWSYQAIGNAKIVSVFDEPCYYYRQRNDSIMGSVFSMKHFDSIEAKLYRINYIKDNFPKLIALAKCQLWFSCIYALQMGLLHLNKDDFKKSVGIVKQARQYCIPFETKNILTPKQKLWLALSRISLLYTSKLRNYLKIGF